MRIYRMQETDIDFASRCTSAEGWSSETREVFEGFFEHDPEGCFIAEAGDRKIGICVATSYGTTGFIGELIVVEEMRGRGVGRRLLEHSIALLRKRGAKSVLLDGDLAAVPLYEKTGFRKICRSLRFIGKIRGKTHPHVRGMTPDDLGTILDIDRQAFGGDRSFFLHYWFGLYPRLCKVLVTNEDITAFIMGHHGNQIVSAGPWVVREGSEKAFDLIESLALESGDLDLRIGVLETNSEAVRAIRSSGTLKSQEPSWRMVLGEETSLASSDQCYAIGSAAKG
jgi:ribosomal protein S18 acetylase RimI-like enzyme